MKPETRSVAVAPGHHVIEEFDLTPDEQWVADRLKVAETRRESGDIVGAVRIANDVLAVDPTNHSAHASVYQSYLSGGNAALNGDDWRDAFTYFQDATKFNPSKPDAWAGLGSADLVLGRTVDFSTAWDRALALGGTLNIEFWHERGFHFEEGVLHLSAKEISFVTLTKETVFSSAFKDVSFHKTGSGSFISPSSILGLKISRKTYRMFPVPLGFACDSPIKGNCQPGSAASRQMTVIARYVDQAIGKAASGSFSLPPPPPAPSGGGSALLPPSPAGAAAQPSTVSQDSLSGTPPNTVIMDEFNGSTAGQPYGISYVSTPYGEGALFSRAADSRIEYRSRIPAQGTLEWWINVSSGYHYQNYQLYANQPRAMIFSTDANGGDVTWPGTTKLFVNDNGEVSLFIATNMGNQPPAQTLVARATSFRFNQWHAIGVSYGSEGEYIMVDGHLVASAPENTESLGAAGNHQEPLDVPTIGDTVSHFWAPHQYDGGFEGIVDRFRASSEQRDWVLSRTDLAAGAGAVPSRDRYAASLYRRMDFGFNGCDVQFGKLKTGVSEGDMIRLAAAAGAKGFTYQPSLRYGKLIIGDYPESCRSPANLSWPLYLKVN